jgi:hypothetical protein
MKKLAVLGVVLVLGLVLAVGAIAADPDKGAIKKQVDDIVAAIDGGKKAEDFADAAKKEPYYVFIMQADAKLLVHPTLVGQSLKEKAEPVYKEVSTGTPEGIWVKYVWKEKEKNTYVRKTKSGLIVGSGY